MDEGHTSQFLGLHRSILLVTVLIRRSVENKVVDEAPRLTDLGHGFP